MLKVLLPRPAIDGYVVKEDKDKVSQLPKKYVVHTRLKVARAFVRPKGINKN